METEAANNINFIPCLKWVRKGVASTRPGKVQLSKSELVQIINDTKQKLNVTVQREQAEGQSTSAASNNPEDEFDMENYDKDDESTANALGISSLAELPTETEENFSESDDSEKEDDLIKSKDNLVLVGHVEGDASILEIYVYNEEEESFYVHHDIYLPAFPLCLEWLNYEPKMPKGNYCAIGSMSPIIDVWDIDVMNCLEPAFNLGQSGSRKRNKPHIGHKDAVLSLAWNRTFDHVMASGSADKTILLWDMEQKKPSTTIKAFEDNVQCLEWHKLEAQTLLAGGCDSKAKVFDCRSPDQHQNWDLDGEAEKLIWNPLEPFVFLAGTSKGSVQCFDCRQGLRWSIEAHSQEVTGLALSGQCPGLLLTASPDESIKIWDINGTSEPVLVHENDFRMGKVHCLELCPDLPFVFAAGGDKKDRNFLVYDIQNMDVVKHKFESRELIQLVAESDNNDEEMATNNAEETTE